MWAAHQLWLKSGLIYMESADGYLSCGKAPSNVGIRNITQTKFSYSIKMKESKLFEKKPKKKLRLYLVSAYAFAVINSKNLCNPLISFAEQVLTSKRAYTDVTEGIEMGLWSVAQIAFIPLSHRGFWLHSSPVTSGDLLLPSPPSQKEEEVVVQQECGIYHLLCSREISRIASSYWLFLYTFCFIPINFCSVCS